MTDTLATLPLDARDSTLSDLQPLELVRGHMPKWLLNAPANTLKALNTAMAQSRAYHAVSGQRFSELEGIEAYCAPLLEAEVKRRFGNVLDIFHDHLHVAHVHLMTDDTLLGTLRHYTVLDEPKTLLWAALQNFSEGEALPGGFSPQSRIRLARYPGTASPVHPHQFAALSRELNLGLKYQQYLQAFLGVAPTGASEQTDAHAQTVSNLRVLKRYDMEVDAHIAHLKNNLSDTAYHALLGLLSQSAEPRGRGSPTLDGNALVQSSLSILDTVIDGVVIFSAHPPLLHPNERVLVYIPNDPVSPFFEFNSLQVFIEELQVRLKRSEYVDFFSRFVALGARPGFLQKVKAAPQWLALVTSPLRESAAHYLCTVQLKNMFADARVLAVPTGVLDEQEREQKWQLYQSVGLFIVNVASLFVPVLGGVMLAVAVGQMLSEVYEGVDDWAHGDVDHAREHLLNVALDIVTTAATVVGGVVVKKVASRLSETTTAFFEDFEPIRREDGTARLWNKQLEHYAYTGAAEHRQHTRDATGFFKVDGKQLVTVDGKHYAVEHDGSARQWRIVHPRRPKAFKPGLLHNQQGAWQHAHERPLEWQGSGVLIGRLGHGSTGLDESTLEQIRALTGTEADVMRRVHLENLKPPPMLNVSLKRFEMDRQITGFIEQMRAGGYTQPKWADLQLSLLPHLSGWPEGKGLVLVNGAGGSHLEYGVVEGERPDLVTLTHTALEQGKVLETVLAALSPEQVKTLLGSDISVSPLPVAALSNALSAYASDNRAALFERLYARFNVSDSALVTPIETAFSGLPKPVAQSLVESATDVERDTLRTGKVPLTLAEHARAYLRDGRLNRAFEGFYLTSHIPSAIDTNRLAGHFLGQMPHWPVSASFELRDASPLGAVLQRWGRSTQPTRLLVKTQHGYQRYALKDKRYALEPGEDALLSGAVFKLLNNREREALGFSTANDAPAFNAVLGSVAVSQREASAHALGMQSIKPQFKPPVRMLDGQIGYPLCGLDQGRYAQSLQRRVRDLYPEFADHHVQAYLDSITESQLEPLVYLRARKRQRKILRQALQAWIDAAPLDMAGAPALHDYPESRYQASRMIQRSWRKDPTHMPWIGRHQTYELNLDGLRVGNMPRLPTQIDFSHITDLNLSNMDCRHNADTFLESFTGLRSLQMDHNRLVNLPSQLKTMRQLRQLSLAHNLLYFTAEDTAVLGSLHVLETLNLNDNLLGPSLDLSELPYLRRVYLRRTWIEQWPMGLLSRPMLEAADLRENQLVDIPELIYQASATVTRNISLSGNPLSAATRLRLSRFVAQDGGSSFGINTETLMSETAAFDFWTTGITNHELVRREALWAELKTDPSSEDFFTVIGRLTSTADAQTVRQDLSRRIWEMIEAANRNHTLRRDLMNIAAAPRSCTDSVALTFSALEVTMQLAKLSAGGSAQESDLLNFATGLFRLDQVGKVASDACEARLTAGGPAPDEVEVHLAYRIGLSQALNLPDQPRSMAFKEIAGVRQADLDAAKERVEAAEKTPALGEFVSSTEFWREHLIRKYQSEFSQLTAPYFEQLSELLRNSPEMNSERYLRLVNEVRAAMDTAVDGWSLAKTQAILPAPPSR